MSDRSWENSERDLRYEFSLGLGVAGGGVETAGAAGRGAGGTEGLAGATGLLDVHGLLVTTFSLAFFLGFFFSLPRWSLLPMTCSLCY
jgi:hypothetical protein